MDMSCAIEDSEIHNASGKRLCCGMPLSRTLCARERKKKAGGVRTRDCLMRSCVDRGLLVGLSGKSGSENALCRGHARPCLRHTRRPQIHNWFLHGAIHRLFSRSNR